MLLTLAVLALASPAAAQEGQFSNPTPIDFTRPFLSDGITPRPPSIEGTALPVEVIGREELIRRGNPTLEELVRALEEAGSVKTEDGRRNRAHGAGVSSINLRTFGSGVVPIPPAEPVKPSPVLVDRSEDSEAP